MSIIEELKAFHSNPKKVEILTEDSILGRDISESTLLAIFRSACNHSFHYVGNTLFIQAVRSLFQVISGISSRPMAGCAQGKH